MTRADDIREREIRDKLRELHHALRCAALGDLSGVRPELQGRSLADIATRARLMGDALVEIAKRKPPAFM